MFDFAIALTGSIASGKSTVCSLLKLQGFAVIDADSEVHKILEKESLNIANLFGDEYLKAGKVDRKKLGNLIFNNEKSKKRLEEFILPLVKIEITKQSQKLEKYKFPYIIDIPLFFETKNYDIKDVVVIYTPQDIIIKRLIQREGLSEKEAKDRLNLQIDIETKKNMANFVIDNSKNLKHLQNEVDKFAERIKF